MPAKQQAAVDPQPDRYIAWRMLNIGGRRFARGSEVPRELVASSFNDLVALGAVKVRPAGWAPRPVRPAPKPIAPKTPAVEPDHLIEYAKVVRAIAMADPQEQWAIADDRAGREHAALRDRAMLQWARVPKNEHGTPLPDGSAAESYRRLGRRTVDGFLTELQILSSKTYVTPLKKGPPARR
jgi:hypothetical protein